MRWRPAVGAVRAFAAALTLSLVALVIALGPQPAHADGADDGKKAFAEAEKAGTKGPADVSLAGQATLKLPAGHLFVPQPHATTLLNVMGNPGRDPRLQGLVFPLDGADWFMTVRYEDAGYIKDDDARDWKADELLQSYREGTEAANEERARIGAPALEILGWAEKPAYDAATHRLVWAMSSRHKGAAAGDPQGVNYNTYVLGREGYFSLNLVTELGQLNTYKPMAQTMLSALNFDDGKRYSDFDASTDKVAEYGLAALVVGAAAKKLGLLAVIGVFLAKFAKVIFVGLALFGGLAMKVIKGRRKTPAVSAPPPSPPGA